ncbi:uncharacterized [Tachysurus ichikawai]
MENVMYIKRIKASSPRMDQNLLPQPYAGLQAALTLNQTHLFYPDQQTKTKRGRSRIGSKGHLPLRATRTEAVTHQFLSLPIWKLVEANISTQHSKHTTVDKPL